MTDPAPRNVEARLLKQRVRRRRPGDVSYPLEHYKDLLDFYKWDHMFLFPFTLTIHQFDVPPPSVLDLGCGDGYWAIEAAKQWKDSTIVGFDIKKIQPKLDVIDGYQHLARRVKWVHGNLLEKLPFPSRSFDFVHIVGIGLGVPEDEWQFVLEEVARVLKPSGVMEIVEEDLLFPCGPPPFNSSPLLLDVPSTTTLSTNTLSSSSSTPTTATTPSSIFSDFWTTSSDQSLRRSFFRSNSFNTIEEEPATPTHSSSSEGLPQRKTEEIHRDVQDHSKLKAAWEAMLTNRFLTQQVTSVLPFYLSSTFVDVRSHPSLQVPLPPNSGSSVRRDCSGDDADFNPTQLFDMSTPLGKPSADDDRSSPLSSQSAVRTCSRAPMHLSKTVGTITACKEAIWIEYEKLYGDDQSIPPVARTPRQGEITLQPKILLVREIFERLWTNWQDDMMDRIKARDYIRSEFSWGEPVGDRPQWRVWRDSLVETNSPEEELPETDLCRSIRGFVGWNKGVPSTPATPSATPSPPSQSLKRNSQL